MTAARKQKEKDIAAIDAVIESCPFKDAKGHQAKQNSIKNWLLKHLSLLQRVGAVDAHPQMRDSIMHDFEREKLCQTRDTAHPKLLAWRKKHQKKRF